MVPLFLRRRPPRRRGRRLSVSWRQHDITSSQGMCDECVLTAIVALIPLVAAIACSIWLWEKKWTSICRLCGLEFLPKNKQPRILYTRVPTCPASGCVIALIVWRIGPVVRRLNQTVAVGVSWHRGSTLRRALTNPPACLKIDPKNLVRLHHFPY